MVKIKKSLLIISLLLIFCISLGAVSATDMDVNDINNINDVSNVNIGVVNDDSSQKDSEIIQLSDSKLDSNLTVDSVSTIFNSSVDLVAHLESNATGNITFYIDDIEVGNAEVENGIAKYAYIPTEPGNFTIKAVYAGDEEYLSSNATANLTANKIPVTIISPRVLMITRIIGYFDFSVVDANGKGVGGLKLSFIVHSKNFTKETVVTTGRSGSNNYPVFNWDNGGYMVTIKLLNDYYSAPVAKGKIIIKYNKDKVSISNSKINSNNVNGINMENTGNPLFALLIALGAIGVESLRRKF